MEYNLCITDLSIEEASYTAYGDVSMLGMGFYFTEMSCVVSVCAPAKPTKGCHFLLQSPYSACNH